jgi:RNA polymerase sigma factor (sigma-70 family)
LFGLNGIGHDNSIKVVASRQAKDQMSHVQRDVYDSHRHRVFALAFYMTGNELEAEDILTGTFITAFRRESMPQAEHVDSALIGELRQRFPLSVNEAPADLKTVSNANADLAGKNVRRTDLEEAIQMLPATERLLFLLRDVEGYSPAAISQLLDMPESKVQRGLFSARIRLRGALASAQSDRQQAA